MDYFIAGALLAGFAVFLYRKIKSKDETPGTCGAGGARSRVAQRQK